MARIIDIEKLTLKEMMLNYNEYSGLPEGLVQMPIPDKIKIKGNNYDVPMD
jgi:hypothetical protein